MEKGPPSPMERLTMREACELLAVSASTLRRWSDRRAVPFSRTPGGHRRYDRQAIESFAQQLGGPAAPAQRPTPHLPPPLDWHIAAEDLSVQPWHASLAPPDMVTAMRALGQRVLGLLIQYITRSQDDPRFLQEAREAGTNYGALAVRYGANLQESMEAFIFFRKTFSQTSLQMPHVFHSSDPEEVIRFMRRINQFMDEILRGLVSAYETEQARRPAPKARGKG